MGNYISGDLMKYKVSSSGQRIKDGLKIRGMKQIELSEKTSIARSAISQYCSDKYEPKQNALYLIAKALNVAPTWLMGLDVEMDTGALNIQDVSNKYADGEYQELATKRLNEYALANNLTQEEVQQLIKSPEFFRALDIARFLELKK